MKKHFNYYQYEEKVALRHLKKLTGPQTLKMGLELSDFAVEMLFSSILEQSPSRSRKAVTNKFCALLRSF